LSAHPANGRSPAARRSSKSHGDATRTGPECQKSGGVTSSAGFTGPPGLGSLSDFENLVPRYRTGTRTGQNKIAIRGIAIPATSIPPIWKTSPRGRVSHDTPISLRDHTGLKVFDLERVESCADPGTLYGRLHGWNIRFISAGDPIDIRLLEAVAPTPPTEAATTTYWQL